MAKKDKNKENKVSTDESTGSKIVTVLIVLVIVVIWLAIFGVLIKLDVGNFGSEVLYPVLKDVPVLNKILPDTEKDSLIVDDEYPYATLKEAVARIKELEAQLEAAQSTNTDDDSKIAELQAEVDRLKQYEDNQAEFENLKADFYEQVVYAEYSS